MKVFISQPMRDKTDEQIKGCRIENTCAKEYGIKVMESEEE